MCFFTCARKEISNLEIGGAAETKKEARGNIDGPTKPGASKFFVDLTADIGLAGLKSLRNYAVDWDNDGDTDLVTIDSYYGTPTFYRFDKSRKVFIPVLKSPIVEIVRASFLAFYDFNRDGLLDLIALTLNQKTELAPTPIALYLASKKKGKIEFSLKSDAFSLGPLPTSSLAVVDINMDGLLDLYLGNWFSFSKKKSFSRTRSFIIRQW